MRLIGDLFYIEDYQHVFFFSLLAAKLSRTPL